MSGLNKKMKRTANVSIKDAQEALLKHEKAELEACGKELQELLKKRGCELTAGFAVGNQMVNVPVKLTRIKK